MVDKVEISSALLVGHRSVAPFSRMTLGKTAIFGFLVYSKLGFRCNKSYDHERIEQLALVVEITSWLDAATFAGIWYTPWSPIFLRSQSVPYSGAAMPVNVEAFAT